MIRSLVAKHIAVILVFALAGCSTMTTVPSSTIHEPAQPFNAEALKAALEPGDSTISGQAFTRTVGGEVRYAAGLPIYLVPADGFVKECLQIRKYFGSSCGQKMAAYREETIGDGEGRFHFDHLKPGSYWIESTINWGVPTGYGLQSTGATVGAFVDVTAPGQRVETVLTEH